ncbi:DinB family protein [Couchioplanes caeruleus]|uniref:DinB family protein n=1 Tax=Couchioplanes caeruleus TaxID=56438 RepID=UPI0020C01089|nr:DinB family protein [Couchioplanes caeruleus]UQU65180.1 DinB family protein [Couchioplanes caeruleus]
MPGQVGAISNEREGLLAYLAHMRYVLKLTAYGLTPEQLRATPAAGTLSVGGLIKHCSATEEGWIDTVRRQPQKVDYEAYNANFHLADDEPIEAVLAEYDRVAAKTEETVAGIDDLGQAVPVDHSVPWNPKDLDNWSVRWVLLHLIQETARHTGHADIIREAIDGGTAYPIMAAAENWPDSPWMQKWKPSGDQQA